MVLYTLTKCSIDGSYILNDNEEDGYYHYDKTMYDYFDNDGNEYKEVEYLESTGTQYIDTGYGNSNGSKFNYAAAYVSSQGYIVGSHNASEPYGRQGGYYRGNNIWELGYGNFTQVMFETQYNKKYEVEFSTIKGNAYLKVDGNLLISNTSNQTLSSYNYLVFYSQYGLYVTHSSTTFARIYMLQIRDIDDNLICDYIPVIDSTNRPCLFDKVEKKCYYNQGTDEFLYG